MRKIVEAVSNNTEVDMFSKFKGLSEKDKKIIMSYKGEGIAEETEDDEIDEARKKDGSLWTKEEVLNYINTNDNGLYKALEYLYSCQTDAEKESAVTSVTNGKGFNKFDAEFLTSICKQLLERKFLTPKQKEVARKKIKKYIKQLVDLANS